MKIEQVAAILYTVRDFCRTEKDLDRSLGKIKKIGYPAVQVSGVGPIAPETIKELLDSVKEVQGVLRWEGE